jgi:hypothetical protein
MPVEDGEAALFRMMLPSSDMTAASSRAGAEEAENASALLAASAAAIGRCSVGIGGTGREAAGFRST